jgi:hypothetical protein
MSNGNFNRPVGSKKPEIVEQVEEQVGGDFTAATGFLGKALDAFLGYDPNAEVAKSLNRPKPPPVQSLQQRQEQGPHCNTCGGTREVGRIGYEIPCPACQPNSCKTCKGSGQLGTPGFEIDCPMCQINGRK